MEKDPAGGSWGHYEDMTPRKTVRIFTDPHGSYRREDIDLRFRQLLERLSVFESDTNLYCLKKSKIIFKVFDKQIKEFE